MTHNNEALSRLRGIRLDDLTIAQLDSVLGPTTITPATVDQLNQAAQLAGAIAAQRTYAQGIVIPESGTIQVQPVPTEQSGFFTPSGTEVWALMGIQIVSDGGTPTVNIQLDDGIGNTCEIHHGDASTTATSFFPWESPIYLTSSLFLTVQNTDASNNVTATVAFHKLGL